MGGKKRKGGTCVVLFCRGCRARGVFNKPGRKEKLYKGMSYTDNQKSPLKNFKNTTCSALTKHILEQKDQLCLVHGQYDRHVNLVDLSTSIASIAGPSNNKKARSTAVPTHASVGIPLPFSKTKSQQNLFNNSLNNQTLFTPQEYIDREHVAPLLEETAEFAPLLEETAEFPSDDSTDHLSAANDIDSGTYDYNGMDDGDSDNSSSNCDDSDEKPNKSRPHRESNHNEMSRGEDFEIPSGRDLRKPGPRLSAEVELMHIMVKHKMPLSAFQSVFGWAIRSQKRSGFSFSDISNPRKRETVIKEISRHLEVEANDYKFQTKVITWQPSKKSVQIYYRPFRQVLKSLLTNPSVVKMGNFSFPDPEVPYIHQDFQIPSDAPILDLKDGKWIIRTYKEKFPDHRCYRQDGSTDAYVYILVPIILYSDGILVDKGQHRNLTPLNMTLGIFNKETRKEPEAWETIYFHPDEASVQANHNSKRPQPIHKLQNLHTGLGAALDSLNAEFGENTEPIKWDNLPYGGKYWKVKMKFAIAYVIGDTEMHDKLCCKYNNYNSSTPGRFLCRHCNCKSEDLTNPAKQQNYGLYSKQDFSLSKGKEHFKEYGHHPVQNAFDRLDFGANKFGIHLATPGELLHMHQLGCAKRAVEAFGDLVMGHTNKAVNNAGKQKQKAYDNFGSIAQQYGAILSRQSDKDLPEARFPSQQILNEKKKEGKDFAGILLCLMLALLSDVGIFNAKNRTKIDDATLKGQIETFELILGMEEFLKQGKITHGSVNGLTLLIDDFINKINKNCKRAEGNGTNLIKNHLYFHIVEYITMWGHPSGWDSSSSEGHHKTEIKAPARNTQQHSDTLIKQTCQRQTELRILRRAPLLSNSYQNDQHEDDPPQIHREFGPRFIIKKDGDGTPQMKWAKARTKHLTHYPEEVLDFCCTKILPIVRTNELNGFTEHHRKDQATNEKKIFRAHPSFRKGTGQTSGLWYDWATFALDEDEPIPCQILCFLYLPDVKENQDVNGYGVEPINDTNLCQFAVVRKFKQAPQHIKRGTGRQAAVFSNFIMCGELEPKLYLFPCEAIQEEVAVVPNFHSRCTDDSRYTTSTNKFFLVRGRRYWLEWFNQKIQEFAKRIQP